MFGFGSKKDTPHIGALIDVGSESVGIAIVSSHEHEMYPKILFSHRVHMRITQHEGTQEERMRHMREALFSANLILSRDGLEALSVAYPHSTIHDILLTVSAPWSYTIPKSIVYSGTDEVKVTRALIDELSQNAETEVRTMIEKENPEYTKGFTIVERTTTDVRINDYLVEDPLGLKGKDISLVHVTGLMPNDIVNTVEDVGEKVFPHVSIRPHTFLLVLYCVLRELLKDTASLTIVHVTGETTEFGIVENNMLIESISVPSGLNTIIREHMEKGHGTGSEVRSLLSLYGEDKLAPKDREFTQAILSTYTEGIREALRSHAGTHRLPRTAFILAPSSFTHLFKELIEPVFKDEIGLSKEFMVLPREHIDSLPTHDEQDDHLGVAANFFHKLHGCGEIGEA
jgi:hypothetical protein